MKDFNVQRLDNSWTHSFLNLVVGDILVVWLVFVEDFNLKCGKQFRYVESRVQAMLFLPNLQVLQDPSFQKWPRIWANFSNWNI